jgi:THO complex subunit 1 transcription elongation factor
MSCLQLEDVSFRRTVLVQFLIAFQYLEGYSNNEIEKTQAILTSKNAKSLATQALPKLTEEQVCLVD